MFENLQNLTKDIKLYTQEAEWTLNKKKKAKEIHTKTHHSKISENLKTKKASWKQGERNHILLIEGKQFEWHNFFHKKSWMKKMKGKIVNNSVITLHNNRWLLDLV